MTLGGPHAMPDLPDDAHSPSPAGLQHSGPLPTTGSGAAPLLLTKILIPPPRSGVVLRPRLHDHLDRQTPGTVGLLVAPAGSGKTTLLASWVASLLAKHAGRVAWLALEAIDNDPQHVLRYLIAALARARQRRLL